MTERCTHAVPERAGPTPARYAGRGDRWDMGPAFGNTVAEWRERQISSSGGLLVASEAEQSGLLKAQIQESLDRFLGVASEIRHIFVAPFRVVFSDLSVPSPPLGVPRCLIPARSNETCQT
jgi:hypothetical protein